MRNFDYIGIPNSLTANMRQIIYGGILIFMMFRYSSGFVVGKVSEYGRTYAHKDIAKRTSSASEQNCNTTDDHTGRCTGKKALKMIHV